MTPPLSINAEMEEGVKRLGARDFVNLGEIFDLAARVLGTKDETKVREVVMENIALLLDKGELVAGDLYRQGRFEPWGVDRALAIQRIDRFWDSLGRRPSLPDVLWFDTPG